ncbi:MAG: hypothetical protein LBG59_07580 [Candidatus Peribacteria bacterium]|jgi:hypothetical protein|nr:hypothetical protein [Candidatus Peribacteria bacterium]
MIAQRNKNDPLGRKKLEEPLGAVAGQAIALEGDKSRLNMAKSSVLSQFTPESQQKLQGDLEQLARLETQNISNEEIASNM